jgi:hypothetical protein
MKYTNTDSPNIGLNLALYMSMVGVHGYIQWQVPNQVDKQVKWKVDAQIHPIKTKIKQEINK